MFTIILAITLLFAGLYISNNSYSAIKKAVEGRESVSTESAKRYYTRRIKSAKGFNIGGKTLAILSVPILLFTIVTTVPAGKVKVATLFGKVTPVPYESGIHFPVNPMLKWHTFDVRQKSYTANNVTVPSQDQLTTLLDVSVQYRPIGSKAPEMLSNTGSVEDVVSIHLVPKVRSILREQGKSVKRAEDFFLESTQVLLQENLQTGLEEYLTPQGIAVSEVLIRSVQLPSFITNAIKQKKEREQAAERQKAELERFATEQEQKVKTAEAELDAAKLEAEKIKELADAKAYQIEKINKQLRHSPEYVKLKSVEQWDGALPKYSGGDNIPILDLRGGK